jgi:hypothetical protein
MGESDDDRAVVDFAGYGGAAGGAGGEYSVMPVRHAALWYLVMSAAIARTFAIDDFGSLEIRMQLKMFGAGGVPGERFAKGLRTLFDIEEDGWDNLAKLFLTTESFDDLEDSSSPAVSGISLLPEQFFDCVYTLRFILEAWQMHNLQLLDIERDLFRLGYDSEKIDRLAAALLRRIEPAKERVYGSFIRSVHENAILPTLKDVNVVCDIRPTFERYAFPAPPKGTGVDYKKIIGFSYMVLVELLSEDNEGRTRKLSVQMTEKSLAELQSALQRAREQLDILKVSTRDLFQGK